MSANFSPGNITISTQYVLDGQRQPKQYHQVEKASWTGEFLPRVARLCHHFLLIPPIWASGIAQSLASLPQHSLVAVVCDLGD